jgi:hypothetical protein
MSVYDIDEFYVHTVTSEPFLGSSGMGVDLFDTPIVVQGFMDNTQKQVRDQNGNTIICAGTFYTYPVSAVAFPINARVTTDSGVARVMAVNINDSGDLDLPDNVAITLV